ncbi:MAG: phenylphosphate carboxylase subunit delta [Thermoanaerobaculia bacterium]
MTSNRPALEPGIWTAELSERARNLHWLLLDVDGVLTDGRLSFDANGESVKVFDVRDGLGVKLLHGAGVEVGILSARTSPIVEKRSRDLGLVEILQGREHKADSFRDFLARHALDASTVGFIGDDILDLAVLGRCGLAAAPADAVVDVRSRVHYVTTASGGRGAVRELCEQILKARGVWETIVARFSESAPAEEGGDS